MGKAMGVVRRIRQVGGERGRGIVVTDMQEALWHANVRRVSVIC